MALSTLQSSNENHESFHIHSLLMERNQRSQLPKAAHTLENVCALIFNPTTQLNKEGKRLYARYQALNWKRLNMNREQYKSIGKKPKRSSKISKNRMRVLATAKEWKPTTSPKLVEAFSTKTEWATNIIPKLREK